MEKGIIKPSELRIGNWVMDRGYKEWQIDHWETRNKVASNNTTTMCNGIMIETHPLTEYVEFLKPIPLTEEWLLKFGFKKYLDTLYIHWTKESGMFEISTRLPDGFYGLWANGTLGSFQYLHQLQNLYFALTNKELTIKEK